MRRKKKKYEFPMMLVEDRTEFIYHYVCSIRHPYTLSQLISLSGIRKGYQKPVTRYRRITYKYQQKYLLEGLT